MVTSSLDTTLAMMDLRHFSIVQRFEGHEKGVNGQPSAMLFSP
jgi:hypothetical protein